MLTDRQRRVVEAPLDRCTLVNAGPGTGKTHVLVERFLHLVQVRNLGLDQVLVVTFGREAAREVKDRIGRRLLEAGRIRTTLELESAWILNFHGLCHRLLRENGVVAAFDPLTRIIDHVESIEVALQARDRLLDSDLAARAAEAEARGEPLLAGVVERLSYRFGHAIQAVGRAKENLVDVEAALRLADRPLANLASMPRERELHDALGECLPAAAELYETLKERHGLVDFVDLQVRAVRFLESAGGRRLHGKFTALLVDELQDTNVAQMRLLELLAGGGLERVMGVGDERQAIYAFRGARIENIRELPTRLAGHGARCEVLDLTESYRSYQEILDASRGVLPPSTALAAPLEAVALGLSADDPCAPQPVVRILRADTKENEGRRIADRIAALHGKSVTSIDADGTRRDLALAWGHFAILLRGVRSAREYEDALRARGIPYRTIGGTGFYDRREVLDLLAYLRAVANPYDGLALVRILQNPPFGLSDRSLHGLANLSTGSHTGPSAEMDAHEHKVVPGFRLKPYDAIRRALDDPATARTLGLGGPTLARLERLWVFLERAIARRGVVPVSRILQDVLTETGYGRLLLADESRGPVEALRRRRNVERLLRMARRHEERHVYGSLDELVRYLNRAVDEELQEEEETVEVDDRVVSIMTVHKAKGLEWPIVFVAGLTDRSWPMRGFPDEVPFFEDGGIVLRTDVVGEDDGGRVKYPETRLHAELSARTAVERDDEERRILFVAMTRAKNVLHLSAHGSRTRFLDEIAQRLPTQDAATEGEHERATSPLEEAPVAPSPMVLDALEMAVRRVFARGDDGGARQEAEPAIARHVRLSFTQVDIFATCPLRYKLTYRLPLVGACQRGVSSDPGSLELAPVELGSIFHEALERWAHDERPLEELVRGVVRERGWGTLSPSDEKRIHLFVGSVLGSPLGKSRPSPADVEVPFTLWLEREDLAVTVVGAIDRLVPSAGGTWTIVDYKTGRGVEPARYRLQLSIYRLAAERVLGRTVSGCSAYFVHDPEGHGLVDVPTLSATQIEETLFDIARRIAAGRFDLVEHPGAETCWRCPFGGRDGLCPAKALR